MWSKEKNDTSIRGITFRGLSSQGLFRAYNETDPGGDLQLLAGSL